jgi:hypothetical protein
LGGTLELRGCTERDGSELLRRGAPELLPDLRVPTQALRFVFEPRHVPEEVMPTRLADDAFFVPAGNHRVPVDCFVHGPSVSPQDLDGGQAIVTRDPGETPRQNDSSRLAR